MEKLDYAEFLEMLSYGEEFYLLYQDDKYWISQTKDLIIMTDSEGKESTFSDVNDFEKRAEIKGSKLKYIWDDLDVR